MASISSLAIGEVSDLLKTRLSASLNNIAVLVGRPDTAASGPDAAHRRLNLFLYRVGIDPYLRNQPLDTGQPEPIWLVLHYLLTAFDTGADSDNIEAHRLLGQGMTALHELNFLRPASTALELANNPEALKITFEEADVDLLSKVMQGTDEKFRVSAALQVRPVMMAIETPAQLAPLVQSVGPPATPGVAVLPGMGAVLTAIEPQRFVAGTEVTLTGTGLDGYTEAMLGTTPRALTPTGEEGKVTFMVPATIGIAANTYPVSARRTVPGSGRQITSNALAVELMPRITSTALIGALTVVAGSGGLRHGRFRVDGRQFGGAGASIFAALYRDGECAVTLEADTAPPPSSTIARFTVPPEKAIPSADYLVVLRVNGQQAPTSPVLTWA
jgi:hypothetical protein